MYDRIDEADADQMIWFFTTAKTNFEWIPIRGNKNEKDKKVSSTSGKKSLMQLLNEHIGYTLYNVPLTKGYLDQIVDDIKHGKYVCLLKFSNSSDKHVIGIDCEFYMDIDFYLHQHSICSYTNHAMVVYKNMDQLDTCLLYLTWNQPDVMLWNNQCIYIEFCNHHDEIFG